MEESIYNEKYKSSKIRMFLLTLQLLFVVFSININILPRFFDFRIYTMMIVVFIVLLKKSYGGLNINKFSTNDLLWIFIVFVIFAYVIMVSIINGVFLSDKSVVPFVFNFIAMVVIYPFAILRVYKDENEFANLLILATVIQSLIALLSFVFPSVKSLLHSLQSISNDQYTYRVVGLGVIGAKGSIYLFVGLIANAYMISFKRFNYKHIISYLIIFTAIAFVGRTGFYISIILTVYTVFFAQKGLLRKLRLYKKIILVILFSVIILIPLAFLTEISIDSNLFNYTIKRLGEIFKLLDSVTVKNLSSMTIPPISFETLLGVGVTKGYTSLGLLVWHDSGYIQQYFSMGLVATIIFYLSLFLYLVGLVLSLKSKKEKRFWLLIIILMFIIEAKEPFIFALAYPFTVIMMLKLSLKSRYEIMRLN